MKTPIRCAAGPLLWLAIGLLAVEATAADEVDPPSRAVRLAFFSGSVSFEPAGTSDWVAPYVNQPLTTGDQLWCDSDGRVELQLDGSSLRVSANTAISFLNLADNITQVQLSSGTLILRVRRLNDEETFEVDTPNLAFSVLRPGLYRLSVDPSGNSTVIAVRSGQGEVTGGGLAYPLYSNENDVFSGTDQLVENSQPLAPEDAFDAWSADRDTRWDRSLSARYVPADVVGYGDLDGYGAWESTPEYGAVWFPRGPEAGWSPYRSGHWAWVDPWGYTWVDDSPWGFAPFHYGRWVWLHGGWGWIPPPPPGPGYVPTVYAPALVAWVGVGAGIAWFALGPREVYVPSYPVSRAYVNDINISNTTVNTTVVTNVYNTTIVNRTVTNVTYVNRSVPGGVVATSTQAFTTAQPIARNTLTLDSRALANARAEPTAPAVVPSREAVLGTQRAAASTPPAAIQHRAVVARTTPPPPPPSFGQRQAAIRSNGGKPLSLTQIRQIGGSAPRAAPVRIAPPPHLVATHAAAHPGAPPAAGAQPPRGTAPSIEAAAPAPAPAARPAPPVHPSEAPPPPRPPSPSNAESALEREHLQEQQRLAAQQAAERQRLQQQQDAEHQRQLADQARQQLEAQHRAQTAQLLQKHAQEQQALQTRQSAEMRRQNEPPPRPAPSPHPAAERPHG